MKQRYKITIEYDGTGLAGWQKQPDAPSVQGYLEKAVKGFSGQDAEVYGAGRTDAGVHALGQAAHFDLDKDVDTYRLREGLNAHLHSLDAPVAILDAESVGENFHARFSAVKRSYIYKITNRRAPLILDKNRSWLVSVPLDAEKMRKASEFLLGTHDFSSFRAAQCQAKSPLKSIDIIEIEQNGENISIYVEAKSFLHHQVRNIAGTLKMVGDGHLEPSDIKTILDKKDRTAAGATAPAQGLYLYKIGY
jgi:tRNA pseudouridine38-40 synthase